MQPRLCFDFCRQQETAKFFGIRHGRECYCTTYFHAHSTGGQGECNSNCEGDAQEMCGGPDKASLFEMHYCGDSASEASLANASGTHAVALASQVATAANTTAQGLRVLATSWQLGVCSVAPEGQRVCALNQGLLHLADSLGNGVADATHAADVLKAALERLHSSTPSSASAPVNRSELNASALSSLELTTEEVQKLAVKARGISAQVNMTVGRIAGPLTGRSLASFKTVFRQLGDTNASWHAVCALEQIPGEAYAAMADDDPATCADRCISLSTGLEACVAFNYQYKDSLATCQLLSEKGLVEPGILKSVPIFEVSQSKVATLGLSTVDCYAKEGFLAAHPKGPLSTYVVREVTA